jgi:hypothetical protein
MVGECADTTLKTVPLCTSQKPASVDVPFPDCRATTFARRATWRPSRKGLRGSGFAVRVPFYPCSRAELSLIGYQQFPVFTNREFAPKPLSSHAFFDPIAATHDLGRTNRGKVHMARRGIELAA